VIATGEQHSVREFVDAAGAHLGYEVEWRGEGLESRASTAPPARCWSKVDPRYFRPTEVETLLGDAARGELRELVKEMVEADLDSARRVAHLRQQGFKVPTAMSEPGAAGAAAPRFRPGLYVAGHRGLVGSRWSRTRAPRPATTCCCAPAPSSTCATRRPSRRSSTSEPAEVYLAAAKVGGIRANDTYPADFLRDNLQIQTNVIHAAWRAGVRKLCFLGSSCIYPRLAPQPIREDALLTGPLEPTNEWYAIAKIAGIKLCQAYRRQHGFNAISLMPTNLYGPGDNFDLENSHVLPALIRRFHEAKLRGDAEVVVWGTGTPRREFLHVDDLASAVVHLMGSYDGEELVNIGCGEDVSIRELAELVARVVGYPAGSRSTPASPTARPASCST
jgi:GDP-L-fucose synthase